MSQSTDSWEDPVRQVSVASSSVTRLKTPASAPVRDDWELDDDEEEDTGLSLEERNKKIWEDANSKQHHPMPDLVISRGVSASVTTPNLPLNQPPTMKILKRPSASASPSPAPSTPAGETLKEREARYQVARERIFGAANEQSTETTDMNKNLSKKATSSKSPPQQLANKVVRNPRGPPNASTGNISQNGFQGRKKPPTSGTVTTNGASDIST